MARYPSAEWAPIAWMNSMSHTGKTQLVVHITAGEGDPRTIQSWRPFSAGGTQRAGSNFIIFRDGRTVQNSDSVCRSAADRGATHTISVECVGSWGPLTPAQVDSLIRLARDANALDGVPLRLAETSSDAGIGWHRLGVDGNFPAGRYGGRLQRSPLGVLTSGDWGKACPTEPIIDQIHDVILPALAGGPKEEDDMFSDDDRAALNAVRQHAANAEKNAFNNGKALARVEAAVAALAIPAGSTPEQVRAAVLEGVTAALKSIDTTVTIDTSGGV